jgi:hypothetical protein
VCCKKTYDMVNMLIDRKKVIKLMNGNVDQNYQVIFHSFSYIATTYDEMVKLEEVTHRYFIEFLQLMFKRVSFVFIYSLGDTYEVFKKKMRTDFETNACHTDRTIMLLLKTKEKNEAHIIDLKKSVSTLEVQQNELKSGMQEAFEKIS